VTIPPPRRLAYLATSKIPSTEANSVHAMRMAHAFSRAGCEVLLVARPGDPALGDPHAHYGTSGFELALVPDPALRGWAPWGRALRVHRRLREWRPAVVYGRDPHAVLVALAGGLEGGYEVHEVPAGRRRRLERRLLRSRRLRVAVFITSALERDVLDVVPEAAGVARIVAPDGADPARLRQRDGGSEPPQIGYVGHLYRGRGIELIRQLAADIPEAAFTVIGGTDTDLARHRSVANPANLRFAGSLPPHAVGDAIDAFDIVLAPYQRSLETARGGDTSRWMSPLKVFEYMARGRAIVASRLPALEEVLVDGVNALLVDPDRADEWELAIRRLMADEELRAALGARARTELEERYSWDARARTILEHLGAGA
jgi:glycosyltransferase involved in cell wall biosynthesis